MIKKYKFINLPPCLKKIANVYNPKDIGIYECENMDDLDLASKAYPLTIAPIASTKNGSITRHFLVGLAIPNEDDHKLKPYFKKPLMFFVNVPDNIYLKLEEKIKELKKNTSIDIEKV